MYLFHENKIKYKIWTKEREHYILTKYVSKVWFAIGSWQINGDTYSQIVYWQWEKSAPDKMIFLWITRCWAVNLNAIFLNHFLRKRRRVSITFHRLVPVFLDAVNRRHVQSDETLNNRDFHQCYLMSLLQKLPKNSFMLNIVIAPFKDNNSETFILLVMIECSGRLNRDMYVTLQNIYAFKIFHLKEAILHLVMS